MKNIQTILLALGIILFTFSACEKNQNLVDYDLLQHGVPIKIKTPEDPNVKVVDMNIAKDITVEKGENFKIQIMESNASTNKVDEVLERLKSEISESTFFSKFVQEDEAGFIYEKEISEENKNYDFRFVKIQGDQEYIFQAGLMGNFNLEDVKAMYQAVQ